MSASRIVATLFALASTTGAALAADPVWPAGTYKHVLILTVDGFREADLEDPHFTADLPNIRALQAAGITYTGAITPVPADSFPCLLGIMTGANPKTTGVYYDDTYSRTLYPPATTAPGGVPSLPAGTEIPWTEAVSINSGFLNGIASNPNPVPPLATTGYDATALSTSKLPKRLSGGTMVPYYPHEYLKVNTIFEVAKAAGLRTAWCDKHPSYEILNGPSGTGMDDFFGPESEAKIVATPPSNRITGTFVLVDGGANKASKSQGGSLGQDDMRVQAVLNQLAGRTSKGAAVAGNAVPALFGMNFIAVNSASKFNTAAGFQPDNSLSTGSQLNGGIDSDGTVSANLHEAFAHTDASIGKIVAAMKATSDSDGRSLYDNTLIVLTAKHGNTPRLGKATVMPDHWWDTVYPAPPATPTTYSASMTYPGGVAPLPTGTYPMGMSRIDAVTLLWLADQSQTAAAVSALQTFAAANPALIDQVVSGSGIPALNAGMGNPATDDRAPDIIVVLKQNVICATSLKRAEHGGFSAEDTAVPLILAGGVPAAVRGSTQAGAVYTTQIAPTALKALGLDPGALQGARSESTPLLAGALDHAPIAVADSLLAKQDHKLIVPSSILAANDTDADGDPLLVTGVSATTAAGGTVALVDGKVIYTPPASYTGNDSFTYTVRDGARVSAKMPTGGLLGYADAGHTVPIWRSGYGSSLTPVPGVPGDYYALTDRGPNGDATGTPAATDPNAKIFPAAGFHPEIARLRWSSDGSVSVLGTLALCDQNGVPLTGLPTYANDPAKTVPVAPTTRIIDVGYDVAGNALATDPNGIDSEGLVALADGTFWVSDEYGPYLVHFNALGKTIERIDPFAANGSGHKLPAALARRLTNKGMEGLAVTPDGTLLVGMMQSALVNDPVNDPIGNPYVVGGANTYGANNKNNIFLRVVTYRLVAGTDSFRAGASAEPVGAVHTYAYLMGDPAATGSASNNTQAISEITAISDTDFLVDERDGKFSSETPSASKPLVKKSWRFTLTGATPIDDGSDTLDGLKLAWDGSHPASITGKVAGDQVTLETLLYNQQGATAKTNLAAYGIVPLAKDPAPLVTILDKRTTGDLSLIGGAYTHDKVEGFVYANGRVVYSNDDDFGLNGIAAKTLPGSYTVGNQPSATAGGQVRDYGQLLEVDPSKLLADVGVVYVTVSAAGNTPPTIANVADTSTAVGVATPAIPVTVGDAETAVASLGLTATSSDTTLVPASGIALGGSGADRTITVTPVAGKVGATTITLTVSDAQGAAASDTFVVTVGSKVTSSSDTPYLTATASGVQIKALMTVGDSVNLKPDGVTPYRMVGIPDGLGAFDNGDGTFTLLMNHELGKTAGITRAHGSPGAFVSQWLIAKSTMRVQSVQDLIHTVNIWNGSAYVAGTTAFDRFCSADLPAVTAYYNAGSGLGTQNRIFMNGEEVSAGRAMAHVVNGADGGTSWELPKLGKQAWENALACPKAQDKTIVMCDDDSGRIGQSPASELNVYIGTKTNSGLDIDKAGLTNGVLYGVKVTGVPAEDRNTTAPFGLGAAKGVGVPFTLYQYTTNLLTDDGTAEEAEAVAHQVTQFSRIEDGAWDPSNPADYWFITTDQFDQVKAATGATVGRTRLWRLRFADITAPESGGTIAMMLDGTEPIQMLDNLTIDGQGRIMLQEDVGGNAHNGKIWCYTIATGALTQVAKHDAARFGDLVGGVVTAATAPFTNDEESSGIIDASAVLGSGWYLTSVQAHYAPGDTELSEGGQLLAMFVPSNLATGIGGTPGLSASTPYLTPVGSGVQTKAVMTAGESVNLKPDGVTPYRMVGIPDGLGAFDNGDGTFTLLMNHELGKTVGVARAHGSTGAFVSKWTIDAATLTVQSVQDLIQTVYTWNGSAYVAGTTAFDRFCSADLPAVTAYYNAGSGLGTQNRIFMNGEEVSAGRAMAHVASGPDAGTSWVLPKLGHQAWENALACPKAQDKTIVMCDDDSGRIGQSPASELNVYIGTKTNSGLDIDKAGLTNGHLYGLKVTGVVSEDRSTTAPYGLGAAKGHAVPFTLYQYATDVTTDDGTAEEAEAVAHQVTQFSRIEDGAWDPSSPADYYFVTTDQFDQVKAEVGATVGRTRLWRLRFSDIANPESGGAITMLLDGTEPIQMLDNLTIDAHGRIMLLEDVGGNAHNGKIWCYDIAKRTLALVAKHDVARFGDLVGGVVTPATAPFTNDEESSGIIDAEALLGRGWYLVDVQAHYATDSELVEGGQLLAIYVPTTLTPVPGIGGSSGDTDTSGSSSGCGAGSSAGLMMALLIGGLGIGSARRRRTWGG